MNAQKELQKVKANWDKSVDDFAKSSSEKKLFDAAEKAVHDVATGPIAEGYNDAKKALQRAQDVNNILQKATSLGLASLFVIEKIDIRGKVSDFTHGKGLQFCISGSFGGKPYNITDLPFHSFDDINEFISGLIDKLISEIKL